MLGALPLQEEHTQNTKSKAPSPAILPHARRAAMLRRAFPQLPLLSQLLPSAAKGRSGTAGQLFLKKVRKAPSSGAPMTGTRAAAAAAAAMRRAAATLAAAEAPLGPRWCRAHAGCTSTLCQAMVGGANNRPGSLQSLPNQLQAWQSMVAPFFECHGLRNRPHLAACEGTEEKTRPSDS